MGLILGKRIYLQSTELIVEYKTYMKSSYDLEQALDKLGLSDSERRVYMAGLEAGEVSSQELIKQTKMPKPTVMSALDSLRDFKLCRVKQRDGRSFIYLMQPPSAAKAYIGGKVRELDELSQSLETISDSLKSDRSLVVKEANGQAEVQELLEYALRCRSKNWQIIAPRDNALAYMPKSYVEYFKATRKQKQIESQTIWDEKWLGKQVSLSDVLMRKPRYVPKTMAKHIPSLLLTFDDMILAIEGTTDPTAILVQSQAITDTFKLVFELAWRSLKS